MDGEKALSNQQSAISENQNQRQQQHQKQQHQHQHSKPFTAEAAESAEKGKTAVGRRAEALLAQIGAACDELDRLAEENPELVGGVTKGAEEHKDAYLRLKARLQLADQAPRCRWVKQDGTGCGSPQMKKHIYCFAHKQMMEAQALALRLPALEDANAIQIGIMRIQKALIDDVISTKKAGLMLYSMQLALQNVGQVTFGQVKAEELVRETVSVERAVREDIFIAENAHSTPFGRSGQAPSAEGEKTLPLMNADDFDSGKVDEEFVPLPGGAGYRFTRLGIDAREHRPVSAGARGDAEARVNLG